MAVKFRLSNDGPSKRTVTISDEAWYSILDLAEFYGWNPMGTVLPEWLHGSLPAVGWGWQSPEEWELWEGSYTDEEKRLVLFEDALNLSDALERAFLDDRQLAPVELEVTQSGRVIPFSRSRPAVGVLVAVIEISREGAFWIEGA